MLGEQYVLWYAKSNSYSIVDSKFKNLLDFYFKSIDINDFKSLLHTNQLETSIDCKTLVKNIELYLTSCNSVTSIEDNKSATLDASKRSISKQYTYNETTFQIHYDCELVQKTIHPALAHLETTYTPQNKITVFDVYLKDDYLHLFKNNKLITRVFKRNYHLMQGKFIMHLISTIHNIKETDWIGTFHGCTIANQNKSILLVGFSGKGKSTLSTILACNGFELIADDVSPLHSDTLHIYNNPAATSVKKGSFDVLKSIVPNFGTIPTIEFNKAKGLIRYVPFQKPKYSSYPCKALVSVNFVPNSETILEEITISQILEILIPDTWLSPQPKHAKQFLDWLETLVVYKLTYSNNKDAVEAITKIFSK